MDFDLAKKHNKESEKRRMEAKRKLDAQRRDQELQSELEEEYRNRELRRAREAEEERLRLEQERQMNGGIRFAVNLRPYPVARTDDKLELPPSALAELERQQVLEKGELMTFSVSVPGGGDAGLGRTHAGVAEFTAEEGTVGVPPRVALCLTKGAGLATLSSASVVQVRFARLPRSSKSRVSFQPRGQGFHAGGADAYRMDLEHVLQESLRGHTALTEGDWLPIRHNEQTFELVVRELDPAGQVALLNTDLTVEILPSEQTEAEMRAEEEAKAREAAAAAAAAERERLRLERARTKAEALDPEPAAGPDVVQLLLRLPDGKRLVRRFARSVVLAEVLNWVESEPESHVVENAFSLVQKWPGHCRELGSAESNQTLTSLGFARQEALFLQYSTDNASAIADAVEPAAAGEAVEKSRVAAAPPIHVPISASADSAARDEWATAERQALGALDRRLEGDVSPSEAARVEPALEELTGTELVGVFERLVAFGMPPPEAATASKRYAAQLKELAAMGFDDWPQAVRLLDKYNGRLLRVANLLSEQATEGRAASPQPAQPPVVREAIPAPAAPPALPPSAPAPVKDTGAGLPKELVAEKFKELIKAGMAPGEAAQEAIKHVRATLSTATPNGAAAVSAEASAPSDDVPMVVDDKLRELASMGFIDEERNRALIKKFAGRMERVVDALCSGA
jgi:ubiquitin fusion degradation protein 1